MIRLTGARQGGPQRSRRWRISNQFAAFAAIMLFASTQIPAPNADAVADVEDPGPIDSEVSELHVAADHPRLEPTLDGEGDSSPAATGGGAKARELNLNLFLLRR